MLEETEVVYVMDEQTHDAMLALATIMQKHDNYCSKKLDVLLARVVECTIAKGFIQRRRITMQTFLTDYDFATIAKTLDYRRLGKQRVECKQILMALTGASTGWRNHPATKMWRGYEEMLCNYALFMCEEWVRRGYKDTLTDWFDDTLTTILEKRIDTDWPIWINDDLILSHRSNLIRKAPEHYAPLWPDVPNDLPYVWPVT